MYYFLLLTPNDQKYILEKFDSKSFSNLNIEYQNKIENIAKSYILNNLPLSKQFNEKFFYKNNFYTNEFTLDPRFETELLVDLVIQHINNDNKFNSSILELGTGTGCISISIGHFFKNTQYNLNITSTDICYKALSIAKYNASVIYNNIKFIHNNWLDNISNNYDILVSNPPYLLKDEIHNNPYLTYDPFIALFGGDNRIEKYIQIYEKRKQFKHIFLEIHPLIVSELSVMFNGAIFYNDLNNLARIMYWRNNE